MNGTAFLHVVRARRGKHDRRYAEEPAATDITPI